LKEHVITGLSHISQTGNKKVYTSTQNLGKESFSSWEAIKSGVPQGLIIIIIIYLVFQRSTKVDIKLVNR
jgi:hypothetical protein